MELVEKGFRFFMGLFTNVVANGAVTNGFSLISHAAGPCGAESSSNYTLLLLFFLMRSLNVAEYA